MEYKVFVDGQEGTTGLEIHDRLERRSDIVLLKIDPAKKKEPSERERLLNEADIAFLCLPDTAARESVRLVSNGKTRIIDASTAHRTDDGWMYGLPELSPGHRKKIGASARVAVPGCYATGFNLLLFPLVSGGILPADYPVTCHAVSGYSGGGKKLIEKYGAEGARTGEELKSPRFYALGLSHKHLPEMRKASGLVYPPFFTPMVGSFYRGMCVAVPVYCRLLHKKLSAPEVREFLAEYYKEEHFVKVMPFESEDLLDNGFLGATACNNTNRAELFVFGHAEQILLISRFDNLGKGASGAAIQNMNIMLGLDEKTGLNDFREEDI